MKAKVTFILLFITMATMAQPKWNERVKKSNPLNNNSLERKYLGLSISVDPSNAINGGKKIDGVRRNEKAGDFIFRGFFGFDYCEIGVNSEIFPAIDYRSVGLDANFVLPITRNFILLIGPEFNLVWRNGIKDLPKYKKDSFAHFVPGGNLRLRQETLFKTPLFLEFQMNYKYRTDIGYLWGESAIPNIGDSFSGYVGLGCKF